MNQSTIREHLEILIEHGIVGERVLPDDRRQRDLPWRFYGLTEVGRALLSEAGLLRVEVTLQDMYTRLDTTPEIDKYAQAPRPGQATE